VIRQTLGRTKEAAFCMLAPSAAPEAKGLPLPRGTGFFISEDGYFLTARHVISDQSVPDFWLRRSHRAGEATAMLQWPDLAQEWPQFDLALLKVDFDRNREKACLAGRSGFPYIEVDISLQEEGTPVYAFGYPLPIVSAPVSMAGLVVGHVGLGHRTTSAIISSALEHTKMILTSNDAQVYVLDKALNYGNSGGPIVLTETGRVFAVCTRFQPVAVEQPNKETVFVPSLYGVASSISNIAGDLAQIVS
jgi:S1-C subfamily serine protease